MHVVIIKPLTLLQCVDISWLQSKFFVVSGDGFLAIGIAVIVFPLPFPSLYLHSIWRLVVVHTTFPAVALGQAGGTTLLTGEFICVALALAMTRWLGSC